MMGRLAAAAAMLALAACANVEPVGRSTQRESPVSAEPRAAAPTPAPQLVTPPPAPMTQAPAAQSAPTPQARPAPTPAPAPTAAQEAQVDVEDDAIVVPGQRDIQVQPPAGDPRSTAERMEDVRAWDQCVTQVQAAFERDPMRPQLDSPEEYCSRSLGMRNRTAVPDSRRVRR